MLPENLNSLFIEILEDHLGEPITIQRTSSLGGGSINHALRISTSKGSWFAKYNSASRYPGMFATEARGLEILRQAGEISVPAVAGFGEKHGQSMLVLEYIESGMELGNFWQNFGSSLARLHRHTQAGFGLDHNNYIGSLEQYNDPAPNWIDFFVNMRLQVQLRLARDKGMADSTLTGQFERMYKVLHDFFPTEPPSLIHGDLWSGNYMTNNRGEACIVDPAVYYGHRLMDIGMSRLFGGFSHSFYDAYHQTYPMENNWQQAAEVANLYPLLVHVNLFGAGYLGSVKSILKRF